MSRHATILLSDIVGRSAYNVRPEGDPAGVEAMAASLEAHGQLQPLMVRVALADRGFDGPAYEVDDGGCRWDGMRLLVQRGIWAAHHPVAVTIVKDVNGDARERSLAANVVRGRCTPWRNLRLSRGWWPMAFRSKPWPGISR